MALPKLESNRFNTEPGFRVIVQCPDQNIPIVVEHVLAEASLEYGDFDSVAFKTAAGVQQFRSLGGGRNTATRGAVEVPCAELSFFLKGDEPLVTRVVEAIYAAHPYEEPVIFVEACLRTLHIRGLDEDNPNRFWNSPPADWVPEEHR